MIFTPPKNALELKFSILAGSGFVFLLNIIRGSPPNKLRLSVQSLLFDEVYNVSTPDNPYKDVFIDSGVAVGFCCNSNAAIPAT